VKNRIIIITAGFVWRRGEKLVVLSRWIGDECRL